ncbi:MAG: Mur ligase family protein [Pseudomonadota bacterium]
MRVILLGAGTEARAAATHFQAIGAKEVYVVDDHGGTLPGAEQRSLDDAEALLPGSLFLRSPGVMPSHPLVSAARKSAELATTPTGYWLANHAPAGTITITGTKGKSTAASLIASLLDHAGLSSAVYGNIGQPPLNEPLPTEAHPVVEMSSYMLDDVPPAEHFHVITNLYQDHVDWHGSLTAYHEAKLRPFRIGPQSGLAPRNVIDRYALGTYVSAVEDRVGETDSALTIGEAKVSLSQGIVNFQSVPVRANLRVAMAIALEFLDASQVAQAARGVVAEYRGLPSRQEVVPSTDGRIWINDPLATIPEAAIEACRGYTDRSLVLLIGGADRRQEFSALEVFLDSHPSVYVVTFDPGGQRLKVKNRTHADGFDHALQVADELCPKGGVILFSPAAPSAPPYRNFQERGEAFRARAAAAQAPSK